MASPLLLCFLAVVKFIPPGHGPCWGRLPRQPRDRDVPLLQPALVTNTNEHYPPSVRLRLRYLNAKKKKMETLRSIHE